MIPNALNQYVYGASFRWALLPLVLLVPLPSHQEAWVVGGGNCNTFSPTTTCRQRVDELRGAEP